MVMPLVAYTYTVSVSSCSTAAEPVAEPHSIPDQLLVSTTMSHGRGLLAVACDPPVVVAVGTHEVEASPASDALYSRVKSWPSRAATHGPRSVSMPTITSPGPET